MESLRNRAYGILRQSESFFKTDMVYLAKGGFWLNFGQIMTAFIGFLLSIAFANLLTQHDYGIYKYILSLSGIVALFSVSGLKTSLTRAVAKGMEGEFIRSIKLSIKWGSLMTVVSGLGALYYYVNGNLVLSLGLLIVGAFLPFINSAELYNSFLSGKRDFKGLAVFRIISTILNALTLLVAILLTSKPIVLIGVYFFSHYLVAEGIYRYILRKYKPNRVQDVNTPHLAKHTSIINGISGIAEMIDNILIFHFLGAAPLAVYNFSTIIPGQLAGVIKSVGTLAVPKFSQGDKEEIKRSLGSKSLKIFLFGALVAGGYILMAPFIFQTFFPQYLESVKYSQTYAIIIMISTSLPGAFLDAHIAIRQKYIVSTISNIVKISSIVVGLMFFGIWGVIVGRLIGKTFAFFMTHSIAQKI